MQITMLETRRGSEDGFTVKQFEQGKSYDVSDMLARRFIRSGSAIEQGQKVMTTLDVQLELNHYFDQYFHPQPTRGSAPTNPATLAATGKEEL